jgi:hypothetical protein
MDMNVNHKHERRIRETGKKLKCAAAEKIKVMAGCVFLLVTLRGLP